MQNARKYPRFELFKPLRWDYFSAPTGVKSAFLRNLSEGGCLMTTSELMELNHKIRIFIEDPKRNIGFTLLGRPIHWENRLECLDGHSFTLYRFGIEFVRGPHSLLMPLLLSSTEDEVERSTSQTFLLEEEPQPA